MPLPNSHTWLFGQRWQIWQTLHEKVIDLSKQAVRDDIIIEIVPLHKLIYSDPTRDNLRSHLNSLLEIVQEGAQHKQESQPEQPGFDKTNSATY